MTTLPKLSSQKGYKQRILFEKDGRKCHQNVYVYIPKINEQEEEEEQQNFMPKF